MNFWLIYLVYPIIGAIVGLIVGSLILIPVLGKRYGFSIKESFMTALLNK